MSGRRWRHLLTVDDNLLPYATVPLQSDPTAEQLPSYGADLFNSFIVALPEKIYYPADAIEVLCQKVQSALESSRGAGQEPLELQRYFITTVSKLREHAREQQSLLGRRSQAGAEKPQNLEETNEPKTQGLLADMHAGDSRPNHA